MKNNQKTILSIDDDAFVRELLADALREHGYQVIEAEDGYEGLKQVQLVMPDAVLLDLRMPKLDGLQVLDSLVKNVPEIPVIIVSGQGTMDDVIKALRLGAWDYLIKPVIDFDLLQHTINKAVERAELIRQNKRHTEELAGLNQQLEQKVHERTRQLSETLEHLHQTNTSLKRQNIELIRMLSQIIEMRPGIYQGHSKFVAEKSVVVAKELGMDEEDVQDVLFAGLLLQIGKMSLPDTMLTKPFYKLKTFERKAYLMHAVEGQKLLSVMPHLKKAAYLIRCQYEHFNGSGVPDGIQGEQIPLGSRILSVMQDYFTYHNGIISGEKQLSWNDTFKRLIRFKGQYYDPEVLELFINIVTGKPYKTQKLVMDIEWFKVQPGMQIVEVRYKDRVFVKDAVATDKMIERIKEYEENFGSALKIKVQLR